MKKTFALLLSLFILIAHATAQVNLDEKILKELAAHPQQDSFRVNRLNELALSFALTIEERQKFAGEALSVSLKTGYVIGEGIALACLSLTKQLQGSYQEAGMLIKQADTIAKKTSNPQLLAILLYVKAANSFLINDNGALAYLLNAEKTADETGNKRLLYKCQYIIGNVYSFILSNFPKAMEYYLKSIQSAEQANDLGGVISNWISLGILYSAVGDQDNAWMYFQKAEEANKQFGSQRIESHLQTALGERYRVTGKYPQAIKAYNEAIELTKSPNDISVNESNLADVYTRMDSLSLAFQYAFRSLKFSQGTNITNRAYIDGILSRAYLKKKMPDSALYYARLGLDSAKKSSTTEHMRDNAFALSNAYAFKKDFENAYHFHLLYINYRDSMLSGEVRNKTAVVQYNSDLQKKQLEITALSQQKKAQQNFLFSTLIVLALIIFTAILLLRNNRQKQKANKLLQRQKQEIDNQKQKVETTLSELKSTQAQLIQSEKMASLGELTAGIAHEIQNPLNFVNNFSEVNREMLEELKAERLKSKAERNDTLEDELINDVIDNEEKISHHGKRADAIVKGMLQHSRTSTGQKELTDINKLADEYLRLAYHGLRAKDKSFNTDFKTDFDPSIGKINIVPPDIGRVLLNLFNNAFYAMHEKAKLSANGYQPTATVSTKKVNGKVEIHVKDNGNGIPQNIVDKIFQPFFTTKPTGQGTGLGLSLSYDIVKAHGGEIKVETKEGEGSEFIITFSTSL